MPFLALRKGWRAVGAEDVAVAVVELELGDRGVGGGRGEPGEEC